MPDEKNLLENVEDDSMAELDSLEGFAEIDDLSVLEGIEEFKDLADMDDLADLEDLDIPLPEDIEEPLSLEETLTDDIPLPDMDADGIEDAVNELSDAEPDGASEDAMESLPEELPMPEEDTADALVDAIDDTAEELPMPEEDAAEETADAIIDAIDDTAEELPMPEDDTVDALLDAIDDTAEELPMPEEDAAEETADAIIDAIDDTAEELPMPEEDTADAVLDAMDETAEEASVPDGDDGVDNMLDGLLDDLGIADMELEEEEEPAEPIEEIVEEEPEDTADLFDLLNNSDDTLAEEDLEEVLNIGLPEAEGKQAEEESPGLLKRLFGNVVNDEIAEAEKKAAEEEEAAAAEKAEQDALRKEEKAAEKAEKAEQKAAAKAAKAEQKAAKKAEKAAAKAEKKAKKEEEAAKEEQFEVTGKLNKVGVAIIAICTVVFLTVEILGTNLYGISRAKRAANSYFELGKYTQAYQEMLGTNLKEKDPDTYNKIKTVMQVQRSIDAYNNYNEMNYYPDALNALLRGIERYDSNLERAKELDVVSDMDHCKAQILSLLNSEFGVSESQAYALLALDKEQYTTSVVQLAMSRQ